MAFGGRKVCQTNAPGTLRSVSRQVLPKKKGLRGPEIGHDSSAHTKPSDVKSRLTARLCWTSSYVRGLSRRMCRMTTVRFSTTDATHGRRRDPQNNPAMRAKPSRAIGASKCSFGACCEQPAHRNAAPRSSSNATHRQKYHSAASPRRLGKMVVRFPLVRSIDCLTQGTHGSDGSRRLAKKCPSLLACTLTWPKP